MGISSLSLFKKPSLIQGKMGGPSQFRTPSLFDMKRKNQIAFGNAIKPFSGQPHPDAPVNIGYRNFAFGIPKKPRKAGSWPLEES